MGIQMLFGTALLTLCALIHAAMVAACIPLLPRISQLMESHSPVLRNAAVLICGLFAIVAAHTIEIWSWALAFIVAGAFEEIEQSFYFATVTYTTLGYGDVVLDPGLRVFGTFASVTGLLTFGISTALLIGIVLRLLPENPTSTN